MEVRVCLTLENIHIVETELDDIWFEYVLQTNGPSKTHTLSYSLCTFMKTSGALNICKMARNQHL